MRAPDGGWIAYCTVCNFVVGSGQGMTPRKEDLLVARSETPCPACGMPNQYQTAFDIRERVADVLRKRELDAAVKMRES